MDEWRYEQIGLSINEWIAENTVQMNMIDKQIYE